jgi:hypothetical protein
MLKPWQAKLEPQVLQLPLYLLEIYTLSASKAVLAA